VRVAAFGGEIESALRAVVWDPFAAYTGCTVESGRSFDMLFSTPIPGVGPDLRLVDPIAAAAIEADGTAAPFDPAVLPTGLLTHSAESLATVPAFGYALVNARRRGAFPEGSEPIGWSQWWDTTGRPAARALGRDPIGTLEIALLADGVATDGLYPLDVDRALAALDRVADSVDDRWWARGIESVGWLGQGRADLASAWHHRVFSAQWDGLAVDLSWPGGLLAIDRWSIPASAREPDLAAELAAFALLPETQAAFARETRMGPVNPDAFALVEPWLRPTLPTAPEVLPQLARLDGSWWSSSGPAARAQFERWLAARSPG
jgi:putative spermidine/putrescine transport system substrate-binding protein